MKRIILIGPETDQALLSLADYLNSQRIEYVLYSDLHEVNFGVWLNNESEPQVSIWLPEKNVVATNEELSLFIRSPYFLLPDSEDSDLRFAKQEYFASFWTLCALLPNVINKPGYWGWNYDYVLSEIYQTHSNLSEYWTTNVSNLTQKWKEKNLSEAHVENLVSHDRKICDHIDDLIDWAETDPDAPLRAVFAPDNRYLIYLFVDNWKTVLLNETSFDISSKTHLETLRKLASKLNEVGLRFYAIVFLIIDNNPSIVRIIVEPPFSWYANQEHQVNSAISKSLMLQHI